MKKIFILCCFLSLSFVSSCSSTSKVRTVASEVISERLASFQNLSLEILLWRSEVQKLVGSIDEKTRLGKVLTGEEINKLLSATDMYLFYYTAVMKEVETSHDAFRLGVNKNVDYSTARGQDYLFHIKRFVAAETILYDNYLSVIYPIAENRKLRRLVRFENIQIDRRAFNAAVVFGGKENQKLFSTLLELHLKEVQEREVSGIRYSNFSKADLDYLDRVVDKSLSLSYLERHNGKIVSNTKTFLKKIGDIFDRAGDFIFFVGSKLFGNAVGTVEMRKGKLIKMSLLEQEGIKAQLQPLDLLLESTPFRLTAKFIPGYYGHVAVWVGNEAQIRALGIWEHPVVKRFHKEISEGRLIVEALRSGVEINNFQHFLNIDDLLVIRHKDISPVQKRDYIIKALEQVGKAYDFNFNVESEDTIVCSELAYVVFESEVWPTSKMLGRFTISPDDVAGKALDNGPFEVKLMYVDGKQMTGDLEKLLKKNIKPKSP